MASQADDEEGVAAPRPWLGRMRALGRFVADNVFSSLTRRIAIINLAGLVAMVSAILYLNQFREGLTDARVESLLTQGEIIANALAQAATARESSPRQVDPETFLDPDSRHSFSASGEQLGALEFPLNPEEIARILRRLIQPTRTRARIYDREGSLLLDSRYILSRGQILSYELPPPNAEGPGFFTQTWDGVQKWLRRGDLPSYRELGPQEGRGYSEVDAALNGSPASLVRVNERGEMIVSVAVPIQRFRVVLGALLLSTQGGDIDAIVRAERMGILRIFLVAAAVTVILSILLAGTIAGPVHRLAAAAERVRYGRRARAEIPDFTDRHDEIGHLSRTLREMTRALYARIDAIETFAADVAHELKNPLTSLRSAIDTLPLVKKPEDRERLLAIIQHDLQRIDRLISDISDASRLDAELARSDAEPVEMRTILEAVVAMANDLRPAGAAKVVLQVADSDDETAYYVNGHDTRLGQVINNLIDNARSFSPEGGEVRVKARRLRNAVEIAVEDEGPGIPPDNLTRIFERFYTDRGERETFGSHSGLGLSISKQIVEAHQGRIYAENRMSKDPVPKVEGARFVVRLPAITP
ncbi:sensor histidine kinase [Lutibaculum baratangense]|uniref:histidine kinase n=1 Tax=Lutibaculum baratangense AMV1 TaxID=631454 RepID=V4R224_9HYPH|nr:sensor histidine kinase [Lutibaculum baratangense]ESR25992.1 Sensor histidine kinase ChvG [Lutibaculum baratangense AMV1]